MSRPRFLADEDLRFDIVQATRRLEPTLEFQTVSELGRKGRPDIDLLEFARENNLIVISHDVTTLRQIAEAQITEGKSISGVLLTPQRSSNRDVAECLVLIWHASEAEEWLDRIEFIPI